MQLVLLFGLIPPAPIIVMLIHILPMGTSERNVITIAVLVLLIVYIWVLRILRQGHFHAAVRTLAIGLAGVQAWIILSLGISGGALYFLAFIIPITITGLLGNRRTMIQLMCFIHGSLLIILALQWIAPHLTGFITTTNNAIYIIVLFIIIMGIIGIVFDRFGFTLEDALKTALIRQRELETLQATLEDQVQERTAALQVALSQEAVARNSAEVARAEAEIARMTAEKAQTAADEANRLKSTFLANMSHELRTPLNAIINYTYFLSNPTPYDETEDHPLYLERVRANADHLLGMINDILDLSKIEAGQITLVPEPVLLSPLLQSVAATVHSLLHEKPVELILDVDSDLPVLMLDKTRIRQVLLNLLSNAAKFTEHGQITLSAVLHDGAIELSVTDTGIGIPTESQARIFEEFQQVEHTLNRTYAGTGLGLPISRRLVELHGGTITLQSTVGCGSSFVVRLPLTIIPAADQALAPSPCNARIVAQPSILIVDDDPDTLTVLRRILEGAGFLVHSVEDSRTVLEALHQTQPDLVILDIRMPHLDGWAVLQQIRFEPKFQALPIILCSIIDIQPPLIGLLGVADYLVKPVRSDHVLAAVLRWISPAQSVLLIDDDPDVRTIIHRTLTQAKIPVTCAASGAEGLRCAEDNPPGLILLDLMIPNMDGFQVITELHQTPQLTTIPLIVMTAKDLTPEEQDWLQTHSITTLQKAQVCPDELPVYLTTFLTKQN